MADNDVPLSREDKIVDPLAIQLAIEGKRKIRLTSREQAHAVRLMLDRGDTVNEIAARLGIPADKIRAVIDDLAA